MTMSSVFSLQISEMLQMRSKDIKPHFVSTSGYIVLPWELTIAESYTNDSTESLVYCKDKEN